MEESGRVCINPFDRYRPQIRIPNRLPKNLTADELKLLIRNAILKGDSKKEKPQKIDSIILALELMVTTGIRVSELCSIRLMDIDFASRSISIHGKGNRERIVFIVDKDIENSLRTISRHRERITSLCDYLFVNSRGTPVTTDYIRNHLKKYAGVMLLYLV